MHVFETTEKRYTSNNGHFLTGVPVLHPAG